MAKMLRYVRVLRHQVVHAHTSSAHLSAFGCG